MNSEKNEGVFSTYYINIIWNELNKLTKNLPKEVSFDKNEQNYHELCINTMGTFLKILSKSSCELENGLNNFLIEIMDLFGEQSTLITNVIIGNLDNILSEISEIKKTKFYFDLIKNNNESEYQLEKHQIKNLIDFLFIKKGKNFNMETNNYFNTCIDIGNKIRSNQCREIISEKYDKYEKIFIASETIPKSLDDVIKSKLIPIERLCTKFQSIFNNLKKFNYIQSQVFNSVYLSNRNVLVAAPTGSGKTNVALLAILKSIALHIGVNGIDELENYQIPDPKKFKIAYIAPMKSLVAEITRKYSISLRELGIKVIDITSDETVTKEQIDRHHIIVTVPEKFDILTRTYSFENSIDHKNLLDVLECLILDEIHMLGDERGPSVEAIVSRIFFNMEISQRNIRIIGLSATLPNWQDFASFLNVQKDDAYFFDQIFRPTPLEKTIIGVFEKKLELEAKKIKQNKYIKSQKKEELEQDLDKKFNENEICNLTDMYNSIVFDIIIDCLKKNEQVLVFVHSRNETLSTAQYIKKKLSSRNLIKEKLRCKISNLEIQYKSKIVDRDHQNKNSLSYYLKMIKESKNSTLNELFNYGLGIHHAGLLSNQRKLSETLFTNGLIKVLFTTATLAWGVNLPARHVIIKGTNVYDNIKGKFKDLSILDILQIFGRAGRPQYEKMGSAYLITTSDKVQSYIEKLTFQAPIESQLSNRSHLCNMLNSEIARGCILNINDACKWLRHTFLIIRARKSPLKYGITWDELNEDPNLTQFSYNLIKSSLTSLYHSKLINFNFLKEEVNSTYYGKLASKYYIDFNTANIFREKILECEYNNLEQTDFDILMTIGEASEFSSITTREEEILELEEILRNPIVSKIIFGKKLDITQSNSKIALLIIAYTLRIQIKTPTLIMDSLYISQNSTRILRFIFELTQLSTSGTSERAQRILEWSKMLEHRIFHTCSLLRYFVYYSSLKKSLNPQEAYRLDNSSRKFISKGPLKLESIIKLEEYANWDIIREISYSELKGIVYSDAKKIFEYIRYVPNIQFKQVSLSPISPKVAKLGIKLFPCWNWQEIWHGNREKFHLWISNPNDGLILYTKSIYITQKNINDLFLISDIIPIPDDEPPYYLNIRILSDKWVNIEFESEINLRLAMENFSKSSFIRSKFKVFNSKNFFYRISDKTELLKVSPIPISALKNPTIIKYYHEKNIFFLNPIQSQLFHVLFHTDENIFLGSPTGSGKTMVAEIAIFRVFMSNIQNKFRSKIVYIAPLKSLAKERLNEWSNLFFKIFGLKTSLITGNTKNPIEELKNASIIISTPEKWESIIRKWWTDSRSFVKDVKLIIFDEIHLISQDPRGSVMEILVCKTKYISKILENEKKENRIRMISLSTSLSNAKELSLWLEVDSSGYYNFSPVIRPVPCTVYISGYQEKNYCPRMASMNRPIYNRILEHSPEKPVIIFVASRRQTRITALALSHMCLCDGNPTKFLNIGSEQNSIIKYLSILNSVKDKSLRQTLEYGIGIHHAGLVDSDRNIVESLFAKGTIQIVIATSTLAWGVNFPAHFAIIKGTEYFDGRLGQYLDYPITDVLQMIGRAGRPQYDTSSVACIMTLESKKSFYKRFLYDSLPLESCFSVSTLIEIFNAEIASQAICTTLDALCFLSNSFFFTRLISNPAFYDPSIFQNHETFKYKEFNFEKYPQIELVIYILEKFIKNVIDSLVKFDCIILRNQPICTDINSFDKTWSNVYPSSKKDMNIYSKEYVPLFFYPTVIGQIASFFYVKCGTVSKLNVFLQNKRRKKQKTSWVEVLSLISQSLEFEQHPVRHNEDLIFSKMLSKFPLGKLPFESMISPHQKVFLLLQTYIFSIPVSVIDFVNDINSILEQVPRILHAFIALNKFGNYVSTSVLNSITLLLQCIQQKCHPFVSSLFQIPGIDEFEDIQFFESKNIRTLYEFIYKARITQELDLKGTVRKLNLKIQDLNEYMNQIPLFQIKARIMKESEESHCIFVNIITKNGSKAYSEHIDLCWIAIEEKKSDELIYFEKLSKSKFKILNHKNLLEFELKALLSPCYANPNSEISVTIVSEKYLGVKISYLLEKINI